MEKPVDFWAFGEVGRKLAALHINYEEEPSPKDMLVNGKPLSPESFPAICLVVNKMVFLVKAYEYIVNGNPP